MSQEARTAQLGNEDYTDAVRLSSGYWAENPDSFPILENLDDVLTDERADLPTVLGAEKQVSSERSLSEYFDKTVRVIQRIGLSVDTYLRGIDWKRAGGVTVGSLTAVTALTACVQEQPAVEPSETSTAKPSESATPTPTPTPEITPTLTEIPESLKKYEDMSIEQFGALGWEEQVQYWPWLSRDMNKFMQEYLDAAEASHYDPNNIPPTEAPAVTNDVKTAVQYAVWAERLVFSLEGDDAYKALMIVSPNRDSHYDELLQALGEIQAGGAGVSPGWIQGGNGTLPIPDNITETSRTNNIVSFNGANPNTGEGTSSSVYYGTFTNPVTNQTEGSWF